jgi:threonine aldolase
MKVVDLRSDTLTVPTPAMREAMMAAEVGDDVFGEDPTINALQEKIAELTGKEAALFVTSGTQGNQICVNAHTRPGQEVICDRNCHIFNYESGAGAMLAGIQLNGLDGNNGILSVDQIADAIRPEDDHYPQTGLICLENTHNRGGGNIYPIDRMKRIYEFARSRNLPVHLDGARLWNASVATGISIKEYCRYTDSVSLCFSKGLGAPVGSIVAGSKAFIKQAHFYRKAYGGGIRQGGILAAAALYALEHHFPKLQEDHRKAKYFAGEINQLPGISIDPQTVETNIVIFEVDQSVIATDTLVQKLQENGVRMFKFGPTRIRAVFYLQISDADVQYAVDVFHKILD